MIERTELTVNQICNLLKGGTSIYLSEFEGVWANNCTIDLLADLPKTTRLIVGVEMYNNKLIDDITYQEVELRCSDIISYINDGKSVKLLVPFSGIFLPVAVGSSYYQAFNSKLPSGFKVKVWIEDDPLAKQKQGGKL